MSDTICAISTATATAALGVIRISGPETFSILSPLLKRKNGTAPEFLPGKATLCRIEYEGEVYDEAVVTFYEGPRSYTGEDTAELSCHGGLYLLKSVLELLIRQGCRLADPGEFSKRAFLNGKLDLTKAESVMGLIDISLLRVMAAGVGIHEVVQRKDNLMFYSNDFAKVDVGYVMQHTKHKIAINAVNKPYISAQIKNGESPLEVMKDMLHLFKASAEQK